MPDDNEVLAVVRAATLTAARAEGLSAAAAQRLAVSVCRRLQQEFGTTRVYIPAPDRQARDRAILAGLASGETQKKVAKQVGVHVATVVRVARRRQGNGLAPDGWAL